ncbi:hypothetical protein Bca4012_038734 [Brassica carinata]
MEGKVFLGRYFLCVVLLLLGQIHGYKSCVETERKALLELKKYIISITKAYKSYSVLRTWTYDTKSDCCTWEGVICNQTSQRVTEIAFGTLDLKESSLLNLSLLHAFKDVRSLNLSKSRFSFLDPIEEGGCHGQKDNQFSGFFDVVEEEDSITTLEMSGLCWSRVMLKDRELEA